MEIVTITDNYPVAVPQKIMISNTLVKCKLINNNTYFSPNWYRIDFDDSNWIRAKECPIDSNWVKTEYHWIWSSIPAKLGELVLFRREFLIPEGIGGITADLEMAADDFAEVYINNQRLAETYSFKKLVKLNISKYLFPGKNIVAFKVINSSGSANITKNPAGLYFKITVYYDALDPLLADQIISSKGPLKAKLITEKKDLNPVWYSKEEDDRDWVEAQSCTAVSVWGNLREGKWKWFPQEARGGDIGLFRRSFSIPAGFKQIKAIIKILADDMVELYINGVQVINHTGFTQLSSLNVSEYLSVGKNILGFKVKNTGERNKFNPAGLNFVLALSFKQNYEVLPLVYRRISLQEKDEKKYIPFDDMLNSNDYKIITENAERVANSWYLDKGYTFYEGYHFGKYISFEFKQQIIKKLRYMEIARKIIARYPQAVFMIMIADQGIYDCFQEVFLQSNKPFINFANGFLNLSERWSLYQGQVKALNYLNHIEKPLRVNKQKQIDLLLLDRQLTFSKELITLLKRRKARIGVIYFNDIYKLLKNNGIETYLFLAKPVKGVFIRRWQEIRDDFDLIKRFEFQGFNYYRLVIKQLSIYFNNILENILGIYYSLEDSPFSIRKVLLTNDKMNLWHFMIDYSHHRKIKTVVNQHGVIFGSHGYFPLEADELICWGPRSREWFLNYGVEDARLKMFGSTRFDNYFSNNLGRDRGYLLAIMEFTEFYTASQSYAYNINLLALLTGVSQKTGEKVIIKLHPGQTESEKDYYQQLLAINGITNISLVKAGNIEGYLKGCKYLLAGRSTTVLEGVILNKPVIIVELAEAKEKVNEYIKTGLFPYGRNSEEIFVILRMMQDNKVKIEIVKKEQKIINKVLVIGRQNKSVAVMEYLLRK